MAVYAEHHLTPDRINYQIQQILMDNDVLNLQLGKYYTLTFIYMQVCKRYYIMYHIVLSLWL